MCDTEKEKKETVTEFLKCFFKCSEAKLYGPLFSSILLALLISIPIIYRCVT